MDRALPHQALTKKICFFSIPHPRAILFPALLESPPSIPFLACPAWRHLSEASSWTVGSFYICWILLCSLTLSQVLNFKSRLTVSKETLPCLPKDLPCVPECSRGERVWRALCWWLWRQMPLRWLSASNPPSGLEWVRCEWFWDLLEHRAWRRHTTKIWECQSGLESDLPGLLFPIGLLSLWTWGFTSSFWASVSLITRWEGKKWMLWREVEGLSEVMTIMGLRWHPVLSPRKCLCFCNCIQKLR